MIATQSNSNVNDEEDAPCKSGVDNCGAERGTQALWVKVTPHSFTDSQPPPHCIGRAGSRDRGCGVCAQGHPGRGLGLSLPAKPLRQAGSTWVGKGQALPLFLDVCEGTQAPSALPYISQQRLASGIQRVSRPVHRDGPVPALSSGGEGTSPETARSSCVFCCLRGQAEKSSPLETDGLIAQPQFCCSLMMTQQARRGESRGHPTIRSSILEHPTALRFCRAEEFRAVLKASSPPPRSLLFARFTADRPLPRLRHEERIRPLLPVWPRATPGASLGSLVLRGSCEGAAPSPGPRQGGHQTVGACSRVPPPCNGAVCSCMLGTFLWF
ncbi:unnamed protein product [Rangifer tarandus platyrhynchus]|uniref:Uncharacterized protein n=1 Tax=Rangifer tarandus platyrhynchus TaxID=3082113 RepID=A0AC59ZNJ0_RANTA